MRTHVLTLILLWVVVGGCESKTDIPPSPTAPSPVRTVTVRVEGVVLDSDRDEPVPGVLIAPGSVHDSGGHSARIDSPSATTDANGVFALSADVPSDWRNLGLHFSRPGYEAGFTSVGPAESVVVLKLRPTLTIRSGESLQVRHLPLTAGYIGCFLDTWPCRRVIVESAVGELVDIEMSAYDPDQPLGLERTDTKLVPTFHRRLTVSKEIWVVGAAPFTTVTLTATRAPQH